MTIHHKIGILLLIICSLLATTNVRCQASESRTFQKIDELLALGENQQARQLLQLLPEDGLAPADRLWRMARVQYEMGRLAEQNNASYFEKAEQYARAAVASDPNNSESYKWLAISLGAMSKYADTKDQIRYSREIKESIDKAIVLNPDDDIAYLVLSRWHYKISALGFFARTFVKLIYGGLPSASLEEAEALLWKAIGLQNRIAHRYNLAKVYKRMGRRDDATEQLRLVLLLPVTFPEEAEEQDKSRAKLQERD